MKIFLLIWLLTGKPALSTQQTDTFLRIFNGQPASYKRNDQTTAIQFKLWPPKAAIYYISCNISTSFNGPQTPAFRWANGKMETLGSYTYFVGGSLSGDTFSFNIAKPNLQKEGWFFCKANTEHDVDITGVASLTRKIDPLEQVTCSSITMNQSNLLIPWKFAPRRADILLIRCYHKPISEDTWTQVYEFNRKDSSLKSMGKFTRRLTHRLVNSEFVLQIRDATEEEDGTFDCEFSSEEAPKPLKASCALSLSVVLSGKMNFGSPHQRGVATKNIVIPIVMFILGLACGAAAVSIFLNLKRRNRVPCLKKKATNVKDEEMKQLNKTCIDDIDTGVGQQIHPQLTGNKRGATALVADQRQIAVSYDDSEEPLFFYLEADNSLSLETLKSHFFNATGLTQTIPGKVHAKDKRIGVRCTDGRLYPLEGCSADTEFRVIYPKVLSERPPQLAPKDLNVAGHQSSRRNLRADTSPHHGQPEQEAGNIELHPKPKTSTEERNINPQTPSGRQPQNEINEELEK